ERGSVPGKYVGGDLAHGHGWRGDREVQVERYLLDLPFDVERAVGEVGDRDLLRQEVRVVGRDREVGERDELERRMHLPVGGHNEGQSSSVSSAGVVGVPVD